MPAPIVVSHSELDAIRQCGHKADLAYFQRWSPITTSPSLAIGRVWHEMMAEHYRALQSGATDTARLNAVARILVLADTEDPERADLLGWMYDGHCEVYGTDPDWEIVSVEDQRLIRLPTTTGRASRFYLRMRADLIIRERNIKKPKLWLVDHKSGKNLPVEKELDLDDQFGLYTWGLRRLGDDIFGAIYSAARTQRNVSEPQTLDSRFSRTRLYRTDRELETIAREAFATARAFYRYRPGEAPRAPDTSPIGPSRCRFKCPFTEPCLLGRKAGPAVEQHFLRDGGFVQLTEDEQLAERGYPDPLQPPN
jgi:hypothetical protein